MQIQVQQRSSALKTERETTGGPVGNLAPGAASAARDQNGFRTKEIRRGGRLPRLETGRPQACSLSARAGISFPPWKQLLENRKSSEKESSDACLRREESSVSRVRAPRTCRLEGGGVVGGRLGSGWGPRAFRRRPPSSGRSAERGGGAPAAPRKGLEVSRASGQQASARRGSGLGGGGGGRTPRAGASRRAPAGRSGHSGREPAGCLQGGAGAWALALSTVTRALPSGVAASVGGAAPLPLSDPPSPPRSSVGLGDGVLRWSFECETPQEAPEQVSF